MLIRVRRASQARESEVTPETVYRQRRQLMRAGLGLAGASLAGFDWLPASSQAAEWPGVPPGPTPPWLQAKLAATRRKTVVPADPTRDATTPFGDASQYNNFYEFGSDKDDPARLAGRLKTAPWSIRVDGAVHQSRTFALEDLIGADQLQERIYRLRCVEAWSMVIPWIGIPLASLLGRLQPLASARYVGFQTLQDPAQMPGQASSTGLIDWPYREGLRLDEAMHPLTLLVVGNYGRVLPNQNGAPLRLIVPWKYGFKSIKSIVRISLLEQPPATSWNRLAADEYGFYANVNPKVDHPRWSQATERRLPNSLFHPNIIDTRMFNGYDEVASLYRGMDLRRWY